MKIIITSPRGITQGTGFWHPAWPLKLFKSYIVTSRGRSSFAMRTKSYTKSQPFELGDGLKFALFAQNHVNEEVEVVRIEYVDGCPSARTEVEEIICRGDNRVVIIHDADENRRERKKKKPATASDGELCKSCNATKCSMGNNQKTLELGNLTVEPENDSVLAGIRYPMMEQRRNSEEWMADYTLRQAVANATGYDNKVMQLVKTFEAVMQVPKFRNHATTFLHQFLLT